MQLDFNDLSLRVSRELETLSNLEVSSYTSGKLSAIQHCVLQSVNSDFLQDGLFTEAGITYMNQFIHDRLLKFDNSVDNFDKGMYDGYKMCLEEIFK